MLRKQLIKQLRHRKNELDITIREISEKSGVSLRSVNRILAGDDVRFSAVEAVIEALELSILINQKRSA